LVSKRVLPYNAPNLTAVTWSRPARGKTAPSTADAAGWSALAVRRQGPGFSGGGLSDGQISDMFSSLNLLEADAVEPLTGAPAGAEDPRAGTPAFRIQTEGGDDARFDVLVYRRPGGGWLATNAALGLEYRLAANAFDSFPAPVTTFLGIAKPARATPPPHAPNTVTPTGGTTAPPGGNTPAHPARPATPTTP
jgi:hypothetical protein